MLSNDFDTGISSTVSNLQNSVGGQIAAICTTANIGAVVQEITALHSQIVREELESKEARALGWYRLGKIASAIKNWWNIQHQPFEDNWKKNFPDISIRRIQQAISLQVTTEEKILKLAKLGFDNMYIFLKAIGNCDQTQIYKVLETTRMKEMIKNYDDPLEEGLHRLHCFCEFAKFSNIIDFDKVDIELLWDVLLANKTISDQEIKAIQERIANGNNVDDSLTILMQTGGGDKKSDGKHSMPSINVVNSMHIMVTEYYLKKDIVPDDFDLNRLNQTKTNINKLQLLEVDNAI